MGYSQIGVLSCVAAALLQLSCGGSVGEAPRPDAGSTSDASSGRGGTGGAGGAGAIGGTGGAGGSAGTGGPAACAEGDPCLEDCCEPGCCPLRVPLRRRALRSPGVGDD